MRKLKLLEELGIDNVLRMQDAENSITFRKAQKRVMHLVSRRNYSRKELRTVLMKSYEKSLVDQVMEWAIDQKWLVPEDEIAARSVELLNRRNKGMRYIQNYLKEKGLPQVQLDPEDELKKALSLVESRWSDKIENSSLEDREIRKKLQEKIGRFLISRGFESSVVRKVIYEKLGN